MDAIADITVDTLAAAKGLDPAWLRETFGLTEGEWDDWHPHVRYATVRIPYHDAKGWPVFDKHRLPDGSARKGKKGEPYPLYGLHRLAPPPTPCSVVLCEGESDTWAAATHGVMAVGVSGTTAWKPEFAATLAGYRVYVWEEPGDPAQRFVTKVAADLPSAFVVTGGTGVKDLCELHQRNPSDFRRALKARFARAVPITARAAAIEAARPTAPPYSALLQSHPRRPLLASSNDAFTREIEQAKRRPIDDVLTSIGIPLHGRGTERMARCPLHGDGKESNPSMSVNVQKGVWRCHACGVGGDAIALVRRARGLDFRSAVRLVAS